MRITAYGIISGMDELKQAATLLGRKGGQVKTAKGFAKMDPERLRKIARASIQKRWDAKRAKSEPHQVSDPNTPEAKKHAKDYWEKRAKVQPKRRAK